MSVTIRDFDEADWSEIFRIHDLARPDELRGSCNPWAFVPLELDGELEHLRSCHKEVAVKDGKVVGFIGIDASYLGWLYIHPEHYGSGIGRALLQSGLKNTGGKAWTIALAGNERAIGLYQSEGFSEVNRYESENAGYPCLCVRLETAG